MLFYFIVDIFHAISCTASDFYWIFYHIFLKLFFWIFIYKLRKFQVTKLVDILDENLQRCFYNIVTRSGARNGLKELYSKCVVRLTRKPYLEKMMHNTQAAKITERRRTLAVAGYIASPRTSKEKFKQVASKPFTMRRQSMDTKLLRTTKSGSTTQSIEVKKLNQNNDVRLRLNVFFIIFVIGKIL